MSVRDLEEAVRAVLDGLRLRWYHARDSRRSPHGFPDLVVTGRRVLFRELKKQDGRLTGAQAAWLADLTAAGADAAVWRPSDLVSGAVARELLEVAGRGARAAR
jgi:hypothetical protein